MIGLPERIVVSVSRTISYGVEGVIKEMESNGEKVTQATVYETIQRYVDNDMFEPLEQHELVWTVANGNSRLD